MYRTVLGEVTQHVLNIHEWLKMCDIGHMIGQPQRHRREASL